MVGFYAEVGCMILRCRKALRFSGRREMNLFRGGDGGRGKGVF